MLALVSQERQLQLSKYQLHCLIILLFIRGTLWDPSFGMPVYNNPKFGRKVVVNDLQWLLDTFGETMERSGYTLDLKRKLEAF